MDRIGIMGGSFNPIHIAHLIIAERFVEEMQLKKCYFIPSFVSPFKSNELADYSISAEHRLKMVKLAVANNNKFEVDSFEISRTGISYTIDTVKYYCNRFPNATLFLFIGEDQLSEFPKWRNWQEILKLCNLCVARRPDNKTIDNSEKEEDSKKISEKLIINSREPMWVDVPQLELSATDIRRRVFLDMSIKYLVPFEVEKYISKFKLYK